MVEPALVVDTELAGKLCDCREPGCASLRPRESLAALREAPAATFTIDLTVLREDEEQQDAVSEIISDCLASGHHGCAGQGHRDLGEFGELPVPSRAGELTAQRWCCPGPALAPLHGDGGKAIAPPKGD